MTNIKKQIVETLKWKKNPSYCAAKLNITEKQYIKLKKQVLQERKKNKKNQRYLDQVSNDINVTETIDLENGTGKLSGTFDHEPKSAEEIISLLKIDTSKWKISQYFKREFYKHT